MLLYYSIDSGEAVKSTGTLKSTVKGMEKGDDKKELLRNFLESQEGIGHYGFNVIHKNVSHRIKTVFTRLSN